jgi:UDP-galactose-lipid carrier transferase
MDVITAEEIASQKITYSDFINKLSLICSDLFAVFCSFIFGNFVAEMIETGNSGFLSWSESISGESRIWLFLGLSFVLVLWFGGALRHYGARKPFWDELKEIIQTIFVFSFIDLALMALSKWELSRTQWISVWCATLILVPVLRLITKQVLMKLHIWQIPCVIVGSGNNAKEAFFAINSERMMGYQIDAFVSPDSRFIKSPVTDIPLIVNQATPLIRSFHHHKFFIALEYEQRELRDTWLRELAQQGIHNISVIPTLRGIPLYGTDMSHFFGYEALMLQVQNNLSRVSARFLKRVFDFFAAAFLLTIMSPLFAYVGYKVTRDGGSAFYGHERVGRNGKKFKCYKFRSMIINSQEVLENLLAADPVAKAEWDKDFKLKNDPRITRIGQFLRKTSLDELPQLWNVLKGDMSLVGPRPIVQDELSRYGANKEYYLMTNPGMTGLWQVSGRSDTDYDRRVYLDVWYAKNWSLWYDIAILFKTINVVVHHDGAY